jgi:hypothetical protein
MLSLERAGGGQWGERVGGWGHGRLPPQQEPKILEQTCEMPMAAASRPHGRWSRAGDRAGDDDEAGEQAMEGLGWRWEAMQCDAI